MGRRGLVLATLMRLKQICNHASHGLGGAARWESEDSGKFARLAEIAATIASRQEKMLVFTQFAEIIAPLERSARRRLPAPGAGAQRRHGGRQAQGAGQDVPGGRARRRSSCCR